MTRGKEQENSPTEASGSYLLKNLLDMASGQEIAIPEFQRRFTWDTTDIEYLFDSIWREQPIGGLLFWTPDDEAGWGESTLYPIPDNHDEFKYWDPDRESSEPLESLGSVEHGVLDGQQRLTALAIGIGYKPFAGVDRDRRHRSAIYWRHIGRGTWASKEKNFLPRTLHFNSESTDDQESEEELAFKFIAEDRDRSSDETKWIRVSDIWHRREGSAELPETAKKLKEKLEGLRLGFQNVTKGREFAIESFARLNGSGKKLTNNDILIAYVTSSWRKEKEEHLTRSDIDKALKRANEETGDRKFNFNVSDLVQAAVYVQSSVPTRKASTKEAAGRFKNGLNWEQFNDAFFESAKLLDDLQLSTETLGTPRVMRPLALLMYHHGDDFVPEGEHRTMLEKMIRRASLHNNPWRNSVLRQFHNTFNADTPPEQLALIKRLFKEKVPAVHSIQLREAGLLESLLATTYGDQHVRRILTYCFPGAIPDNKMDVDHFYPKSKDEDGAPPEIAEGIDGIANLRLLTENKNRSKGKNIPACESSDDEEVFKLQGFLGVPDNEDDVTAKIAEIWDSRTGRIREELTKQLGL